MVFQFFFETDSLDFSTSLTLFGVGWRRPRAKQNLVHLQETGAVISIIVRWQTADGISNTMERLTRVLQRPLKAHSDALEQKVGGGTHGNKFFLSGWFKLHNKLQPVRSVLVFGKRPHPRTKCAHKTMGGAHR